MEVTDSWIVWLISSLIASYLISFAYKNIKHILKHKIVVKRSEAVTREMNRKLADDKKMSKKEKDERILWKKNEVGDYEATTFSIFWNNILFLTLLLILSFFVFASVSSTFNCLFSMIGAAGLVALFSTANMDGRVSPRLEEPINKSEKRNAVPKMVQNGDVKGDGRFKIHRIPLCRTARCFVSHVTSPSCIWVKPVNHITEKLLIRDLNTLTPVPVAHEDRYVMAPLGEGVYARARIRKVDQRTKFVKVLFIDEGFTTFVHSACLAKMDEILSFHPWQAIAVALFKVKPHQDNIVDNVKSKWSKDDVTTLRAILEKFEFVRVEAILNSVPNNDYRDPIKVNIYGMESESDEPGTSVAHLFARERFGEVDFERDLFDGITQKIFEIFTWCFSFISLEADREEIPTVENMETWRLKFPSKDETGPAVEQSILNEATINNPQIPEVDVTWLNKEGYCHNGEYLFNVEGRNTVSPYEFYARPLKFTRVEKTSQSDTGEEEYEISRAMDYEEDAVISAMIAANDELADFAEELNSFYGHPKNRKPVISSQVLAALRRKERIYGIVEVDDEFAQFTGCWQRVEILGVKDGYRPESFFCRIRFLDSGGTDIRLLSSILEINPMHCVRPPLCLQMCMHGLKPVDSSDWSEKAKQFFFGELREDVPITLNIVGCSEKNESSYLYDCQPFQRPDVLFVNFVQVRDGSVTTLDALLEREGYAVIANDSPWKLTD
uniref:Translocon-associated protein subunit gamma n=1 Tax=Setaria digitata TaxID=48799 RepID=A0A915Q867_9BILA